MEWSKSANKLKIKSEKSRRVEATGYPWRPIPAIAMVINCSVGGPLNHWPG